MADDLVSHAPVTGHFHGDSRMLDHGFVASFQDVSDKTLCGTILDAALALVADTACPLYSF